MNTRNIQPAASSNRRLVVVSLILVLAFSGTLYDLLRLCLASDLYSYILLIPLVSAYLVRLPQPELASESRPAMVPAVMLLAGGLLALAASRFFFLSSLEDGLSLRVLALVLLFTGVCAWFLSPEKMGRLRFPLAFLGFMIPIPTGWRMQVESFLQYGSAAAANGMFTLSGVPVFQDGLSFQLPGAIKFNVQPECSGLHSSVVLLITSLVAGHLLLHTRWKQALLVAVVLPLALLRNGFRIYVIGRLCVRYGARMFDSWVHHRGGPLFFAISLVPFFLLLLWLVKSERSRPRPGPNADVSNIPS